MLKRVAIIAFSTLALLMVTLIIGISLTPAYNVTYYFNPLTITDEVEYAINGEEQGAIRLPVMLRGLEPGDEVSVYLKSSGLEQDNLLIESDGAACVLYIDGEPYYSVGSQGTYPSFQKEPARSIDIAALPNVAAGTEIRLDYTVSSIDDSLKIPVFYSGDQNLITKRIVVENYLGLLLSLLMVIVGITLAVIGLVFYSRVELAISLLWLGLACFACGLWTVFANDVILLFFSQFSAFYTISHIGLYVLPLPLSRFFITFLQPYRSKMLEGIFIALCASFGLILILHLGGLVSFGQVEPFFKIASPFLLAFYVAVVFMVRYKKAIAISPLFILGVVLFTALCAFDVASVYWGIQSPTGTFFMVGLSFAAIVIALLVWEYLSDALDAAEKNARLESDISAINRSLDLQRKHFQDFAASVEETRRMRHDLRHQLVAIQGLIAEHKDKEALQYIDKLSSATPSISEMFICDNVVVNALAVHYLAEAEEKGIQCDLKMAVPEVLGRIPDGDLSIIVGNLFENAIEACMHVAPEKRFIRIRGNVAANRFTLVIDNSFDGELRVSGSDFYSRKRKGFGVGIASVRSVVSKYEGSMKYETEPGVFKTSLYVKI